MDFESLAIIIIVIGAVFIIAEAFIPGIFLIVPGTIMVILGAIGYIYPDFLLSVYSPLVVLMVAAPVTIITFKAYQRLGKPEPPTTTIITSLIGKQGVVSVQIEPGTIKGKVMIDLDSWSATSEEVIEVGTEVYVYDSEGVHVKVKPCQ